MKSIAFYLLNLFLLMALVSCGKDNESGKSSYNYPSTYGYNPYTGSVISTSPYSYNNVNAGTLIAESPCTTGYGVNARTQIQFQLTGFNSYLQAGEIYAGVTSYGDIAMVIGQPNSAPLFVAYVCARGTYANGQGQLMDLALGTYSKCAYKQLTRATMVIPGAYEPLYFRMLEGGSSQGTKFSFCSY